MPHANVPQIGMIIISTAEFTNHLIFGRNSKQPPFVNSQTFNNILDDSVAGVKLENQFDCKICYLDQSFSSLV